MAYSYLDDQAWAGVNDSAWGSCSWVRARRNLAALDAERVESAGWHGVEGEPWRLCSIQPVAWAPIMLRVRDAAPRIKIRLRINQVVDEPISVWVTCGGPDGYVDLPPVRYAEWNPGGSNPQGSELAVSGAASSVHLTAPTRGRVGWISCWLWTWSTIREAEDDANTLGAPRRLGGLVLTGIVAPPAGNPPERALYLEDNFSVQDVDSYTQHQVAFWDSADSAAYVYPPLAHYEAATNWHLHRLGVAEVAGVEVEAIRDAMEHPPEASFYGDEPVRDRAVMGFASRLEQLVDRRRRVWMAWPGFVKDNGNEYAGTFRAPLLVRRRNNMTLAGLARLSGTFQAISSCLVANPAPDLNGYAAILGLLGQQDLRSGPTDELAASDVPIELRVSAYTPLGAVQASGTATVIRLPLHPVWRAGGDWRPLAHTSHLAWYFGRHQFRSGYWGTPEGQYTDDARRVIWTPELTIPETGISYPAELRIEARLGDGLTSHPSTVAVQAAGLATRGPLEP